MNRFGAEDYDTKDGNRQAISALGYGIGRI
jgi:hypothetical protein